MLKRPVKKTVSKAEEPPKPQQERRRNAGLLFGILRVEIEDVRCAHKKPCATCGRVPVGRRLHVQTGSGRNQKQFVFCDRPECGKKWLKALWQEVERAMDRLRGLNVFVRSPVGAYPPIKFLPEPRPKTGRTGRGSVVVS